MSNRKKGTAIFAVNFEPTGQSCLDARLVVELKSDLTDKDTYSGNNTYKGMVVSVTEDNTLWILTDPSKITEKDAQGNPVGWKRLDAGSSITDINQLRTDLTTEVDRAKGVENKIISGVGLNSDGTYKTVTGTSYLNTSTSVADALSKLDTQIKTNANAITAVANSTIVVKKGNGINIAESGDNGKEKTISIALKANVLTTDLLEVTEDGIGVKDDAIIDCGTY